MKAALVEATAYVARRFAFVGATQVATACGKSFNSLSRLASLPQKATKPTASRLASLPQKGDKANGIATWVAPTVALVAMLREPDKAAEYEAVLQAIKQMT